uniref:Uncharacterized protein n=1 Tax=Glossina brevipalpis TaxID=37001 RepID=A0A1A9X2D1_9MUSC
MGDFVHPEELTHFIESIRPFQIGDIGTAKWVDVHEMILKLSQQAFLEAVEHREEEVKEMFITNCNCECFINITATPSAKCLAINREYVCLCHEAIVKTQESKDGIYNFVFFIYQPRHLISKSPDMGLQGLKSSLRKRGKL